MLSLYHDLVVTGACVLSTLVEAFWKVSTRSLTVEFGSIYASIIEFKFKITLKSSVVNLLEISDLAGHLQKRRSSEDVQQMFGKL